MCAGKHKINVTALSFFMGAGVLRTICHSCVRVAGGLVFLTLLVSPTGLIALGRAECMHAIKRAYVRLHRPFVLPPSTAPPKTKENAPNVAGLGVYAYPCTLHYFLLYQHLSQVSCLSFLIPHKNTHTHILVRTQTHVFSRPNVASFIIVQVPPLPSHY